MHLMAGTRWGAYSSPHKGKEYGESEKEGREGAGGKGRGRVSEKWKWEEEAPL